MLLTTGPLHDTMSPRLRALQQLIARGGYVVDDKAVATALLQRTDLQPLVPPVTGRAQSRPRAH